MKLNVYLSGVVVGALVRSSRGVWEFSFDEGYLRMTAPPLLGRWFEDQDKNTLRETGRQGFLPPFFQNYLPEQGSLLRTFLCNQFHIGVDAHGELIAALGQDLPGAIVIVPEGEPLPAVTQGFDPPTPVLQPMRASLAGMQLKFSIDQSEKAHNRFVFPASGQGGRWIVKLPDRNFPGLPRHEATVMTLARAVGISVPPLRLVPWREIGRLPEGLDFTETDAFVIQRYDRDSTGNRIHQEDFAQVLNRTPEDKFNEFKTSQLAATYESIGSVIRAACGVDDFEEYLRRLVFMILTGNGDAHLKNWSLYYPNPRQPRLSPAYDLLATHHYYAFGRETLALRFLRKKEFRDIGIGHFVRLAEKAHHSASRAREIVQDTRDAFEDACFSRDDLEIDASFREGQRRHLDTLIL